jgi:putative addiction module component (TIGR02574 family)
MNATHAELFASVLALPQTERADLAYQLLQSLDPPGADAASPDFGEKLLKRARAAQRGEIDSISLEEMRASMNQRFNNRARS